MPRSGKLSVLNSLTGQKSCFSPRMGDSVQRYTSNLAGATGTWVRLAVQNFTSIATGVHPVRKTMRWIEKWINTVFVGLDELYHYAKFGEDRTTRAGCRCENVVFVTGRMPWSGKLQVFNLLTGQISGFRPTGRLVAPIQVKFGRADGHAVYIRLAVQNFTSIGTGGGNAAPKISKISTFW